LRLFNFPLSAFSVHSFSQSSSDGTVTSAFVLQSGTAAGQVGVFRAGKMHRLGIVPQRRLRVDLELEPAAQRLGRRQKRFGLQVLSVRA
jgi:hypothetical protein